MNPKIRALNKAQNYAIMLSKQDKTVTFIKSLQPFTSFQVIFPFKDYLKLVVQYAFNLLMQFLFNFSIKSEFLNYLYIFCNMDKSKALIVLITGTNKGLGFDLVKLFLKNKPQSIIFATSRQETTLAFKRWSEFDKNKQVRCKKLDICQSQSIESFCQQIRSQNVKIDILVNNAGFSSAKDSPKSVPELQFAKRVLNTNIIGPIKLTKKLLPYLSDSCRIVNVSSLLGALKYHPQNAQKKFQNTNLTEQDILKGAQDYLNEVQTKKIDSWNWSAYGTSKMLLNAWSRFVLQKKWLTGQKKAVCVSPGFCRTPMTKDFPDSPFAYTSQSGAFRIYETIFLPKLDSQIFYHRARQSDYFSCGESLPYDPIQ